MLTTVLVWLACLLALLIVFGTAEDDHDTPRDNVTSPGCPDAERHKPGRGR